MIAVRAADGADKSFRVRYEVQPVLRPIIGRPENIPVDVDLVLAIRAPHTQTERIRRRRHFEISIVGCPPRGILAKARK